MAQRKPEEQITLNQVLKLVHQLPPEEQSKLRCKLDELWEQQWDNLASRIQERCKNLPPLTDEEIIAEVKAVREARRAKRVEGSC